MIAFVLLCGCLPFDDDSARITSETAARRKFTLRFPKWAAGLSASAKDLLHNLLDVNPKTRFTAEQALSHPWVSGKTVQANNYLNSPSILASERRKEMLKSPMMQAMQSKMTGGKGSDAWMYACMCACIASFSHCSDCLAVVAVATVVTVVAMH